MVRESEIKVHLSPTVPSSHIPESTLEPSKHIGKHETLCRTIIRESFVHFGSMVIQNVIKYKFLLVCYTSSLQCETRHAIAIFPLIQNGDSLLSKRRVHSLCYILYSFLLIILTH
jgi:hypothetical protein